MVVLEESHLTLAEIFQSGPRCWTYRPVIVMQGATQSKTQRSPTYKKGIRKKNRKEELVMFNVCSLRYHPTLLLQSFLLLQCGIS